MLHAYFKLMKEVDLVMNYQILLIIMVISQNWGLWLQQENLA